MYSTTITANFKTNVSSSICLGGSTPDLESCVVNEAVANRRLLKVPLIEVLRNVLPSAFKPRSTMPTVRTELQIEKPRETCSKANRIHVGQEPVEISNKGLIAVIRTTANNTSWYPGTKSDGVVYILLRIDTLIFVLKMSSKGESGH